MFFNFRKFSNNKYLITNDYGFYSFLNLKQFNNFISGKKIAGKKSFELKDRQFIANNLDFDYICEISRRKFYLDYKGPRDHIISLTNKCNLKCHYCFANPSNSADMTKETAQSIVDFILSLPLDKYYIELTGGEPFKNFETMKFLIDYANKKAEKMFKKIHYSVVSNLTLLNEEHLDYIIKNKISLCVSIDATKSIHNVMRGGYEKTISNFKKALKKFQQANIETPNIITTITRPLLTKEKEIIDNYIELKINRVQLGILEQMGRAKEEEIWKEIGYDENEYFDFYKRSIDYILELNIKKGLDIYEKGLFLLIHSIFKNHDFESRSVDLFHRFAYDVNGWIYPSDEGRMIGDRGDFFFKIANVRKTSFKDILNSEKFKAILLYRFKYLVHPSCARCVYAPYCIIHPYYNYISQKNVWGNMAINKRCKLFIKIFDMIFKMIENKNNLRIFEKWLKLYGN
ncbi:MAG: radical SAM protein [Elusimicrobiota bacterium]